jgi:hypothetical protein
MKEANPVKFYLAKYFFLAIGLLQGLAAVLLLLNVGNSPKTRFTAFVLFTLAMIFVSLHLLVSAKLKRVAISKKKIAVIDYQKVKRYEWSDVKAMKFFPFLNLYSLKLKGKKSKVYFLPTENSQSLFGIFNPPADFAPKKVSKA